MNSLESVKITFDQMMQARTNINQLLNELTAVVRSGQLFSNENGTSIVEMMNIAIRLQDECLAMLQPMQCKPSTVIEMTTMIDELEQSLLLSKRVETAKESVRQFGLLQCKDEEIAEDFISQQAKVNQLLQELDGEELITAAEIYSIVVDLVRDPDEKKQKQETYRRITREISYGTREALANGCLYWPNNSTLPVVDGPEQAKQKEEPVSNLTVMDHPESDSNRTSGIPEKVSIDFSQVMHTLQEKHINKNNFSVKQFEGDLKQMAVSVTIPAFVMSYVYQHGMISLKLLQESTLKFGGLKAEGMRDTFQMVLQKLVQKGYLAEYQITFREDSDNYYVLTEYGSGAFRKETSRKLIQSHCKLSSRLSDDWIRLEPDHVVTTTYRLKLMEQAFNQLDKEVEIDLNVSSTLIAPFPHRTIRSHQVQNYWLIPGALDRACPREDLERISEVLLISKDAVILVAVTSTEIGRFFVDQLSTEERPLYYICVGKESFFVGDREGNDVLDLLFQIKDSESTEDVQEQHTAGYEQVDDEQVTNNEEQVTVETAAYEETVHTLAVNGTLIDQQRLEPNIEPENSQDSKMAVLSTELSEPIESDDLAKVVNTSLTMLTEGRQAEGLLLLHSVAEYSKDIDVLRRKASFVLDDPLKTNEDWFSLADTPANLPFSTVDESLDDYLNAAMWLRIFFDPDNANDYRLNNRWRQINDDLSSRVLEYNPAIKRLISYFWNFIERHHVGIKYCTSGEVTRQVEIANVLEQCKLQVEQTLQTVFQRNIRAEINHPKIHAMMTEFYGNSGLFTHKLQNAFSMPLDELRNFAQQFTDVDLSRDFEDLDVHANDGGLEIFLDRYWKEMDFKSVTMKNDTLTGALRNRMRSRLREAAELLLQSYVCRYQFEVRQGSTNIPSETVNKTRRTVMELLNDAHDQLEEPTSLVDRAGTSCLRMLIRLLRDAFSDMTEGNPSPFYESALLSGIIELDGRYLPILNEPWLKDSTPIEGYRMWERILRHCSEELPTWEEAAGRSLRCYDMGMYDLIVNHYRDQLPPHLLEDDSKVEETRNKKDLQFTKYKEEFMTAVESAQNYGQLASKDELYAYIRLAEAAEKHARETGNAGFFKMLLDECMQQIRRGSDSRVGAMRNRLEKLKEDILRDPDRDESESDNEVLLQWPILGKIERMLEKRNMTVAEDYIQLAGSGQKDTPSIDSYDRDIHALFLEKYQMLYNMCNLHKRDDLNRTYEQSVRRLLFQNQNNRNTASANKFISSWYKVQPQKLEEFMEQLMFDKISRVEKNTERDNEYYVFPAARDAKLGQYPHPFDAFGTRAVKNGVRVLMMAGVRTANNILDEVAQKGVNASSATIVILDYALPLAQRQALAKSIKLRSTPDIIVVIDRVMALFLAGYNQIERGSAFLMASLPSSKIQPYIPEGVIPSEMFIGRTDELAKIQNPNGPVFVYGGRQLGKTALLRESKHREHDPDNGKFAFFIDLKKRNVGQALNRISEELVESQILDRPSGTWEELTTVLRKRLADQNRPIRKLMLLLDEADSFIADCEVYDYRPLEMLKELKDTYNDRFKFVLAGLRDVVRFNKQRLSKNSVLAHLGHITIRPLKYLDARDLLLRPLQYLGFRIAEHGEDIISLILAKTNYYPGLVHFYCQKLIEVIADSYRNGNYSEGNCPPYVLDEKHIKTLLGQSEFLAEIDEKFQITLQLDSDNLYDILATALAFHYYEKGIGRGAAASDFIKICKEFGIEKINRMSVQNVRALLDEMEELNIFSRETPDTDQYVFNRFSFFQMLGNQDQVWEHLFNYSDAGEC